MRGIEWGCGWGFEKGKPMQGSDVLPNTIFRIGVWI